MKKSFKITLGMLTFWPFLYFGISFLPRLTPVLFPAGETGTIPEGAVIFNSLITGLFYLTMILIVCLLVFYMIRVFKNDRLTKWKKAKWLATLYLGSMFTMPIYWYFFVWREPEELPRALPQ